jgi:hypothetical protein
MRWIDENTRLSNCEVCGKPILVVPFGAPRKTCSLECRAIRAERAKIKSGEICPCCGRAANKMQADFNRRHRKHTIPDWLQTIWNEAEKNPQNTPDIKPSSA